MLAAPTSLVSCNCTHDQIEKFRTKLPKRCPSCIISYELLR
uniref:Uncharacterized protein n=1 Tax=Arundo donax TaxID=35708 RepID=A0A0A9GLM2_ARUDO